MVLALLFLDVSAECKLHSVGPMLRLNDAMETDTAERLGEEVGRDLSKRNGKVMRVWPRRRLDTPSD